MTEIKPDIPDSGKYTAKKAAELLDVKPVTIYRHVNAGLLIPNKQNPKNPATSKQKRVKITFSGKEIKRHWENF